MWWSKGCCQIVVLYFYYRHVRLPRIRGIPRFLTFSGSFLRFVQIRGESILLYRGVGGPEHLSPYSTKNARDPTQPIFHWKWGWRWLPNANEIYKKKRNVHGRRKKFASPNARDTNMLVFFALGNAKVLSFALADAKVPNASSFAFWWNIGFKLQNLQLKQEKINFRIHFYSQVWVKAHHFTHHLASFISNKWSLGLFLDICQIFRGNHF